jgi:hypothetical protein
LFSRKKINSGIGFISVRSPCHVQLEEDGIGCMKQQINLLDHDASNAKRSAVGWVRVRPLCDFEAKPSLKVLKAFIFS